MWRVLPLFLLTGCCFFGRQTNEDLGAEYVGARYLNDPLGETRAPDEDPLIRFDAFDCTTFIETALAGGDVQRLNKIRYADGEPDFINRNHFIETDWLENNANIVRNISADYAPTETYTATIDKGNWFRVMHNMAADFTPRTAHLEYIPYKYAADIAVTRPVVVLFLRANPKIHDKIGTDLVVRHMGFLLPDGTLRHASRRAGAVVDTNFRKYVQRMMESPKNLGIIILEIKK